MKYLHENFIELLKQCVKSEDGMTCLAKVRINEKRIVPCPKNREKLAIHRN